MIENAIIAANGNQNSLKFIVKNYDYLIPVY